jgi:hypothetical protein
VLLEILKIVLPMLGGGAIGALINEWFRRKNSRVQAIPLIERVNRRIKPELEGITLARVTLGRGGDRTLVELHDLREYQLTLKNTSTIHLQDAEIQFEFAATDVEAWASRPSLSRAALIAIDGIATPPWKRAFRWRLPHFRSGDSLEFTFRVVNPLGDLVGDLPQYEVSLYKSDRVIVTQVRGEGEAAKTRLLTKPLTGLMVTGLLLLISVFFLPSGNGSTVSTISMPGCSLRVISSYEKEGHGWVWQSPWKNQSSHL